MREIIFYKTEKSDCPVEKFLDSLNSRQAKKVAWVLQLVEDIALVPIQYFKKLDGTDNIWEVRVDSGNDTFRLLGFFDKGNLVILGNAFQKKSQKTPKSEIERTIKIREEYYHEKEPI